MRCCLELVAEKHPLLLRQICWRWNGKCEQQQFFFCHSVTTALKTATGQGDICGHGHALFGRGSSKCHCPCLLIRSVSASKTQPPEMSFCCILDCCSCFARFPRTRSVLDDVRWEKDFAARQPAPVGGFFKIGFIELKRGSLKCTSSDRCL